MAIYLPTDLSIYLPKGLELERSDYLHVCSFFCSEYELHPARFWSNRRTFSGQTKNPSTGKCWD